MAGAFARAAIVTGAAGGIGAATTRRLIAAGFRVFMVDVAGERLRDLAGQLRGEGGAMEAYEADATVAAQVEDAVARARVAFGRIDALVNVAGGSGPGKMRDIEEIDDALWREVLDLNLTSAFLFSRAVMPAMRAQRYGRIVNFSSIVARGRKGPVTTAGVRLAYATAKAAIEGFTAQLAKDVAGEGITVNCLLPALILAEQGSRIRQRFENLDPTLRAAMLAELPAGRPGDADEVAAAVAFLVSEEASYVNGVALPIDGAFL
jgi:NAD(P)-dependent dehydrogenase (short-subunit alcohol dehydrogenase family)